jgi:hypothetical protein
VSPSGLRLATGVLADEKRILYLPTIPTARGVRANDGQNDSQGDGFASGARRRAFGVFEFFLPPPVAVLFDEFPDGSEVGANFHGYGFKQANGLTRCGRTSA